MNTCNAKGTCDTNGKCVCNAGFYGADCSIALKDFWTISTGTSIEPQNWMHYSVATTVAKTISLTGDNLEIYISSSRLPSQTYFD